MILANNTIYGFWDDLNEELDDLRWASYYEGDKKPYNLLSAALLFTYCSMSAMRAKQMAQVSARLNEDCGQQLRLMPDNTRIRLR